MSRPWLGSKGSWERKPQVSPEEKARNFDSIFGVKYNWLELKIIKESLLKLLEDTK